MPFSRHFEPFAAQTQATTLSPPQTVLCLLTGRPRLTPSTVIFTWSRGVEPSRAEPTEPTEPSRASVRISPSVLAKSPPCRRPTCVFVSESEILKDQLHAELRDSFSHAPSHAAECFFQEPRTFISHGATVAARDRTASPERVSGDRREISPLRFRGGDHRRRTILSPRLDECSVACMRTRCAPIAFPQLTRALAAPQCLFVVSGTEHRRVLPKAHGSRQNGAHGRKKRAITSKPVAAVLPFRNFSMHASHFLKDHFLIKRFSSKNQPPKAALLCLLYHFQRRFSHD